MKGNRSRDTRPEVILRAALHRRGLRFFKNRAPLQGLRCRADVIFPRSRVAIFCDGCFWHRCPEHGVQPTTNEAYWRAKLDRNVERDQENSIALEAAGWQVIRIWEHEHPELAAHRIDEAVRSRLSGR
jgi:DNA mismatch endonuclease (patch repair protein)